MHHKLVQNGRHVALPTKKSSHETDKFIPQDKFVIDFKESKKKGELKNSPLFFPFREIRVIRA
jgi:hypothetical protein